MILPKDKEIIYGKIADYVYEDGILFTQLPVIYTAMAMISKPGLAKFIMNILFSVKKPPIPMKSFTDEKKAREWLQQFVL